MIDVLFILKKEYTFKEKKMTKKLVIAVYCVFIFLTFLPLYAQEAQEAQEADETAEITTVTQDTSIIQKAGSTVSVWVNKIIGYIAQIGNLFGNATGFRIGGTTGTAIAALILAKLLEDKVPSWVKGVLYVTGGTMFAGSGANIMQLVTKYLGQ